MDQQRVVACVGAAFFIIGWFLTTNIKFALRGLSYGRGKMWVRMPGQDPALPLALAPYWFGLWSMFLGLVVLFIGVFRR